MDLLNGVLDMNLVAKVAAIVVGINVVLSAVVSVLDYMKDKTSTSVDNKIAVVAHKVLDFLKNIVDWASANQKH